MQRKRPHARVAACQQQPPPPPPPQTNASRPRRHGGLAFLLKTSSNKWLGNGDTRADFFFDTSCLPEMPLISTTPAAGVGARADADAAQEGFSGLVGPQTTLDTEK
jgi:hypothetical protein